MEMNFLLFISSLYCPHNAFKKLTISTNPILYFREVTLKKKVAAFTSFLCEHSYSKDEKVDQGVHLFFSDKQHSQT